jgi:ABC-type Mn2+/Zn2+ transport system permease subunit
LVVAHSPHGLAEVEHLLASTIIGARESDVWILAAMLALTVAAVTAYRDRLLLAVLDPEMARACGVATHQIDRLLAIWLGIVVAASIHIAGVLFAFGALVLPALAAKNLCSEVRQMLVVAPGLAVVVTLAALVVANAHDYPPAQMAVAFHAAMLVAAWSVRSLAPSKSR